MDVTGNLSGAVAALPKEAAEAMGPVLQAAFDRIQQLEERAATDTNVIADKVIAALVPQLQAITGTVNEIGGEALALLRQVVDNGVHIAIGKAE